MRRWWLFNAYDAHDPRRRAYPWLPVSARIHLICRPDADRHQHDHPWDARTIVLAGWYAEQRGERTFVRKAGQTASLRHEEYHRITSVAVGGAVTLFLMFRFRGPWGFSVDGKKVPWWEYP
jgi:hypothetical protein